MVRKLLVATRVSPAHHGVGTIFLRSLLEMYPADRVAFATWEESSAEVWPATLAGIARRRFAPVPEFGVTNLGARVRRSTLGVHSLLTRHTALRRLIREVAGFGREQAVEAVWVPLASPTEIHLAAPLARMLGVPLLTMVWDPPEHYLGMFWGYHGRAMRDVMTSFGRALARSERCAVASDAMKAHYERSYGVPCVTMIHGFRPDQWIPPVRHPELRDHLVIGYAGSIYAKQEWDSFIGALSAVDWKIGGRDVIVRVLASSISLESTRPARIEFLGWQNSADTLRLLSDVDVCYIPYWFDPRYQDAVRYCFPNKISTYLAAGKPLFFHGPAESTPAQFLKDYPAGVSCHSLQPAEIIAALRRFVDDPSLFERAAVATARALRERLSATVFRRSFAEFIAVREEDLVR